ncbi:hypothetical protein E3N88_24612 [Mikania micrantha]|uniref:Uncharacterized protein n=1 Tax=Mikania micrantha TaxID=192012 RepID=A0A5N6N2N8_9ASTR|nr:hypothetical protein E3N88_24612 [Mikania micrantha]
MRSILHRHNSATTPPRCAHRNHQLHICGGVVAGMDSDVMRWQGSGAEVDDRRMWVRFVNLLPKSHLLPPQSDVVCDIMRRWSDLTVVRCGMRRWYKIRWVIIDDEVGNRMWFATSSMRLGF